MLYTIKCAHRSSIQSVYVFEIIVVVLEREINVNINRKDFIKVILIISYYQC